MRIKHLGMILNCAGLIALLSTLALAQAGLVQIEGDVKLKQPDGTSKPVEGAIIDVYRTDINGHWEVKTDKKGHFLRLGMAYVGVYIVAVSGPGISPTWLNGVRLDGSTPIEIEAKPGDGTRLTREQINTQIAKGNSPGAAKGGSGGTKPPTEAEKKAAEEQSAKMASLQATLDMAIKHYNAGVQLKEQNNLEGALSEFEQAATVDPSQHAYLAEMAHKANANVAETNYQIGADLFNKKQKDEAKKHFETAVAAINKAIAAAALDKSPTINNQLVVYYNILDKNAQVLVEKLGEVNLVPDTATAIDKAEAIDAANKKKWEVAKGDLYRGAGMTDQAAEAYKAVIALDPGDLDALYGLGLTLLASSDKAALQESANYLGDFIAKAPAADKRVPDVKSALEALKATYKVEAEKPAKRRRGGK
ncbi:MAG TPA: hypothetical protein VJX67_11565 [Blastocatellia bacterium]|nr:hypothetical protein [Blastocatellia bacterium]